MAPRHRTFCLALGLLALACGQESNGPAGGGGAWSGGAGGASSVAGAGGSEPMPGGGAGGTAAGGAGAAGEAGASGMPSDGSPPCIPGANYTDPLLHQPVATNVHDGAFGFLEGPLWIASQATLYYTNFTGSGSNGRIRRYRPHDGLQDIWLEGIGANGLALDTGGRIVAAYHQQQRVIRLDLATKALISVPGGDQYQSLPFNSVNDVAVRADGHIYFTDPLYQREDRPGQPVNGCYHLTPAGVVTLIDTQEAPNGVALSPDGRTLYIGGTGATHPLMKYAVAEDGSVATPGVKISDLPSDGMAVDCAGNLYLTTGGNSDGTIVVLDPNGASLGSVAIDPASGTTSAGFGGPSHETLFVTTSSGGLFEVPMVVPGLP